MTHKGGNIYDLFDEKFILVTWVEDGQDRIALFSLVDGNRYSDPVNVTNYLKITDQEFEATCGTHAHSARLIDKTTIITTIS